MKLTIEKAYELSVKKWEIIVKDNGDDTRIPKMYAQFRADCPYCELFARRDGKDQICIGCPLDLGNRDLRSLACCEFNHPWNIWFYAKGPTKEHAQAVLDLIIKTKPF